MLTSNDYDARQVDPSSTSESASTERRSSLRKSIASRDGLSHRRATISYPPEELEKVNKMCSCELNEFMRSLQDPAQRNRNLQEAVSMALISDDSGILLKVLSGVIGWDEATASLEEDLVPGGATALRIKDAIIHELYITRSERKEELVLNTLDLRRESSRGEGRSSPRNTLELRSLPIRAPSANTTHLSLQYRSLFIFSPDPTVLSGKVRFRVYLITDSVWFDRIVMVMIIGNSITLALDIPSTQGNDSLMEFLRASEIFFQVSFTIEMLLKVVAQGFVMHKGAYLRSLWNIMDFVVVITGWLWMVPDNVTVLRLLRVVRPLRVVNRVPQMKSIMNALVHSLPGMRDVFLLLGFLVVTFAIVGVQLFQGTSHQRCYFPEVLRDDDFVNATAAGGNVTANASHDVFLPVLQCNDGWCIMEDPLATLPCSKRSSYGRQCDDDFRDLLHLQPTCRVDTEVFEDTVLNFDNFFTASLLVFKIISLDDWPLDMNKAQYAMGWGTWIYFLVLTLFGGFFCINLFLAVLSLEYYRAKVEAEVEEDTQLRKEDEEGNALQVKEMPKTVVEDVVKRNSTTSSSLPSTGSVGGSGGAGAGGGGGLLKPQLVLMKRNSTRNIRALRHSEDTKVNISGSADDLTDAKGDTLQSISSDTPPPVTAPTEGLFTTNTKASTDPISATEIKQISDDGCVATALGRIRFFVHHKAFNLFMLSVTCLNVLVMTFDHHQQPKDLEDFIRWTSLVCSVIFMLELFVKLLGMGFYDYFTEEYIDSVPMMVKGQTCVASVKRRAIDPFNTFDCFLVAVSIPELALQAGEGGGSNFSPFRILRLARMLRHLSKYPTLRQLLLTIIASVVAVAYLFLIMLLFIFISGIFGLKLFQNSFNDSSRENFHSLWESFLTVFIVITGESWGSIMKRAIIGSGNAASGIYFVLVFMFGNYMLINLFIAILIDEFMRTKELDDSDTPDEVEESSVVPIGLLAQDNENFACPPMTGIVVDESNIYNLKTVPAKEASVKRWFRENVLGFCSTVDADPEELADKWDLHGTSLFLNLERTHPVRLGLARVVMHPLFDITVLLVICANVVFLAIERPDVAEKTRTMMDIGDFVFTTLFALECAMKVTVMGLYQAKSPQGVPKAYLTHTGKKDGGKGGNSFGVWNRLDLFVVITAFAGLGVQQLKVTRSLRTVRLVVHFKGIRVVIMALFSALACLANVAVVCLFLWLSFGIMAVQLFKGSFYYCTDPSVDNRAECGGVFFTQEVTPLGVRWVETPQEWVQLRYHFDNLAVSMLTLFEVAVGEGWAVIMFSGIDARGVDLNPKHNANPQNALFFVCFVVVGQFFAMNLFIGMLIDVFSHSKAEEEGSVFMTAEQREWVRANKMIAQLRLSPVPSEPSVLRYEGVLVTPDEKSVNIAVSLQGGLVGKWTVANESITATKLCGSLRIQSFSATYLGTPQPDGSLVGKFKANGRDSCNLTLHPVPLSMCERMLGALRVACFRLVHYRYFDGVITVLIGLNVVLMCFERYNQADNSRTALEIGNWVFVGAFTLEIFVKQMAHGVENYFRDNWNKFDFLIVGASYLGAASGGPGLSVLRIGRIFRLVKRAKNLQKLFGTLIHALPSLGNVSLLLVVTFFIFGVVGVELFGKVTLQGNRGLSSYTNFKNVPYALITLYQVATTETWTDVMDGCMATEKNSKCTEQEGNCGTALAIPYFLLFMTAGSFTLLNLFITIVLDEFNSLTDEDETGFGTQDSGEWAGLKTKSSVSTSGKMALLECFRERWLRLDPMATGKLRANAFIMLVRVWVASDEMKHTDYITDAWMLKFFCRVAIPVNELLMVKYDDAVQALLKELFQISIESAQELGRFVKGTQWRGNEYLMIAHYFATSKILTLWKSSGVNKKVREARDRLCNAIDRQPSQDKPSQDKPSPNLLEASFELQSKLGQSFETPTQATQALLSDCSDAAASHKATGEMSSTMKSSRNPSSVREGPLLTTTLKTSEFLESQGSDDNTSDQEMGTTANCVANETEREEWTQQQTEENCDSKAAPIPTVEAKEVDSSGNSDSGGDSVELPSLLPPLCPVADADNSDAEPLEVDFDSDQDI